MIHWRTFVASKNLTRQRENFYQNSHTHRPQHTHTHTHTHRRTPDLNPRTISDSWIYYITMYFRNRSDSYTHARNTHTHTHKRKHIDLCGFRTRAIWDDLHHLLRLGDFYRHRAIYIATPIYTYRRCFAWQYISPPPIDAGIASGD